MFTIALPAHAQAKATNTTVYYNGEKLELTESPFIEKNKTYVPLRSYFEELGYVVTYSGKNKSITVDYDGYESIINLKKSQITEYGEIVAEQLDLIFRNNTYYAPLRELQPVTWLNIEWSKENNAIYLTDMYVATENVPSEGFLWKVVNGETNVYLLGSIHVGDEKLYPIRDEINNAFEASDIVVTEVDITKELTKEETDNIVRLGYYQDGTTIKDHVSPLTYVNLKIIANKYGLDMDAIDQTQVWLLNMILDEELLPANEVITSADGIDIHFLELAKKRAMTNLELETAYLQYKMLSSFSDEYQEESLNHTLDMIRYSQDGYDVNENDDYLLSIWKSGDLETMDSIAVAIKEENLEYYNGMLANRNKGMTDKIIGYLNGSEPKTYFVIAGALHMAGPDSIIKLLKSQGYTVEQL